MGTYRSVSVSFWTDTKVYDDFSWSEKYLYLYFLTNAHTNICGCYEISKNQMVQETSLPADVLMTALDRLERVHHVIRYCSKTKELLIVNWSKYNWSNSDKLKVAVIGVAQHIKHPDFFTFVMDLADPDGKKERSKERIVTDTDTDTGSEPDSVTVSDSDSVTDVSIGYRHPIDTVSASEGKKRDFDADFTRLWAAYPAKRRTNRETCRALFEAIDVPVERLLSALDKQKNGEEWQDSGGKYIPGLQRWLAESRWEAVPEETGSAGGPAETEAIKQLQKLRDSMREDNP